MSRGLARLHRRLLADERALEVEAERENPLSGRGATPSMGLSEVRGGMVGGMIGPHWTWDDKHAERYGDALAKHLYHLHGAGFLDTLRDGFNSFKDKLRPIVNILKPIANVASMAPGPLGMVGKVASVPLGTRNRSASTDWLLRDTFTRCTALGSLTCSGMGSTRSRALSAEWPSPSHASWDRH